MIITAGRKLREIAIERTKNHIVTQAKGRTQLSVLLSLTTSHTKISDYVDDERQRLKKMESLQEQRHGR